MALMLSTNAQLIYAQNVSINKDGSTPNSSAMLDVSATDAGMLLPRMTESQRDAISTPATGLIIYQTDNVPGFRYYNGTIWVPFAKQHTQDLAFTNHDKDYIEFDQSTFETLGYIVFRGTSTMGVPTNIKAVLYSDGGDALSVRVRDITNGNIVATKHGIANTSSGIIDLGTLSNLPGDEALFAIQGRKNGGDKGRIHSISIQY